MCQVELSLWCLPLSSARMRGMFAICASRLLAHVRQTQHLRLEQGDDVEMEDEEDDMQIETEHTQVAVETAAGLTWVTQTKSRAKRTKTSQLPPALLSVRQHVQALCNHQYVDKLLDVVQSVPTEPGGAGAVGSTCGLVLQLLEFIPEAKTGVLNALAFKPAVLTMLWRILVESLNLPGMLPAKAAAHAAAHGLSPAAPGAENRAAERVGAVGGRLDVLQQESLFTMFCIVYEYFLITADNDDLYIRQYPFVLDEVRDMVEKLKLIIYPMYSSRHGTHAPPSPAHAAPAGGSSAMSDVNDAFARPGLTDFAGNTGGRLRLTESAKKLRATGTKLLNRLYERNCYREFMPAEGWLAAHWAINNIESALDASLAQRLTNPNDTVPLLNDQYMQVCPPHPHLPWPYSAS